MKYCFRTVTWKFKDGAHLVPGEKDKIKTALTSPEIVYDQYKSLFVDEVRERFVVFWLNSANKAMGFEIVTEGLLNSSLAHPREVFRGAIVASSASIILAHNHPSGNAEPSGEDIAMTRQLVEAGKVIGITVHDHIIFSNTGYTSMAERGLV